MIDLRQFQECYQTPEQFHEAVTTWQAWRLEHGAGAALVHVFSDGAESADLEQAMPHEAADPLIVRADAALYEAKCAGKNRVCEAK